MENFKNGAISEADLEKIAGGLKAKEAFGKLANALHISEETLEKSLKYAGATVVGLGTLAGAAYGTKGKLWGKKPAPSNQEQGTELHDMASASSPYTTAYTTSPYGNDWASQSPD